VEDALASGDNFFGKQSAASDVKSRIVTKHFASWSSIVLPKAVQLGQTIAYMDLYCGPGLYDDGTRSTPLLILEAAMGTPSLHPHLVTVFNDKKAASINKLEAEAMKLPGIGNLKYAPVFLNEKVSPETEKLFVDNSRMPSFTFLDPFGYAGLTRGLIEAVVTKSWGSDCVFFFSYSSINRALSAGYFTSHMEAFFGKARATKLEAKMQSIQGSDRNKPLERESIILDALKDAMEELNHGNMYVRPFRFKKGLRTSHMLVFVTKSPKGYRVMSDIMAKEGFIDKQGVPHFTHYTKPPPRDRLIYVEYINLKKDLCRKYAGRKMTMLQIFLDHRQYTAGLYKDTLNELEDEGLITVDPPAENRRVQNGKRSFRDEAVVTFPARKQ
jgi:three-Cys-motif partner protein